MWELMMSSPYFASAKAKPLRDALRSVPRLTTGALNGSIIITGCLNNPDGSVHLSANNVGVDIREIESIVLDASMEKGAVMLNELKAVSAETYIEASPIEPGIPVYRDGKIQLNLSAYNLDISRLRPWLGENTPTGMLTANFEIIGPAQAPKIIGSVEVTNPVFKGLAFDRLRASRIEITDNRIDVADVILASDGHQIIAHGYLPWNWTTYEIPRDQPIEFTAELQREDLSIFSAFVPQITADGTTGAIQAVIDVNGTIADINLSGLVKVENGTLALRGFRNSFNNVNIDLLFDGKELLINQLSAQSTMGGSIQIAPGGYVTIGKLETSEINLAVAAQGLSISEQNILGYKEDITTHINAGLSITRNLKSPLIADRDVDSVPGGIALYDSTFSFVVPETPPETKARQFAINPQFEIGIDIGRNVTIKPPRMNVVVSGGGSLTGTLSSPDFRLDSLEVQRGELILGTSRLRVVPGGTISLSYIPSQSTLSVSNFQATTSVTATNSFGQRERYQITITANGPIDRMQISLASSPPGLTREQMMAAIGHVQGLLGTAEGDLQRELANVLTAVGTSTLFMPVERLFISKLGFEQFSLDYSPISPLSLYLSRRLFNSFYISFYQHLTAGMVGPNNYNWQFQFSYRFRNVYQAVAGVDDQQTVTFQVGYTNTFD
jgi:hypothetical protein